MGLLNVVVTEHSIRLVADTCSYVGKRPMEWNRKMAVQHDARLAVAVRGFHWASVGFQNTSALWADFEDAVMRAADLLLSMPSMAAELEVEPPHEIEVILGGWSEQGPRAVRLTYGDVLDDVVRTDLAAGTHLNPGLDSVSVSPALTDDELVEVALLQQSASRKRGLDLCISGDVEIATITPGGANIRAVAEFPDKAFVEQRMGRMTSDLAKQTFS